MDSLDLKIVREMGFRPYGSRPQNLEAFKPSYLAKCTGVEPETVKARLARMEKSGFIRFYQVYPNFRHLGLQGSAYLFSVPDDDQKAEAIQKVEPIDGLVEIHNFLGPEMCVDMSHRGPEDLSRKLRLLAEFTGDAAPERIYERHMPSVERTLTRLDWRILKALRYKGRRPLAEVADEVGVSPRTIRRRFDRMAVEGSFFVVPAIDPGKAPGILLYELLFHLNPDASDSVFGQVLRLLDERYLYHYVPSSKALGNFDILLYAESSGETEEVRQKVRSLPGIAKVTALVFRAWREYTGWIDGAIEERIRAN
jgi:DNA-binding Lrp family transcriptional regulator